MIIRIERASGIPVTRQILDQIRAQCATDALRPGDRLPSVRELARELAVNQNTVLHVYERLESEGLIERRHGAGTFVADRNDHGLMKAQRDQLRRELEAIVHRGRSLGLGLPEFSQILADTYERHSADSERESEES